jgi:uncharacterized protein (TIGR01777 family)
MHVAITGSTGLIGSALRRSLVADGHRVTGITRRPQAPDDIGWDPADGRLDPADLEGVDALVNLAGEGIAEHRWSVEQKRRILQSRARGTELVASTLASLASTTQPPKVLVSGSAIGFYGDRGDEVLTETSAAGEGFLTEVCKAWEAATAPAAEAGIRVVHVRTGIVLTTGGGSLAKLLPLFRFGLGGRFGSGRQWWSWITLDDEVSAIRFLLDTPLTGPVNLTAPAPVTNAELTRALGRALRRPTLVPVPAFGPKLVLGRQLADALLFSSARVVPAVLQDAGYRFAHPELDGALRSLLSS